MMMQIRQQGGSVSSLFTHYVMKLGTHNCDCACMYACVNVCVYDAGGGSD